MGVSVSVYGVLGVRIPDRNRLYQSRQTRGCSHPLPYYSCGDSRFCPTCGKPIWLGEDVPVTGYDDGRETGKDESLGGFAVLSTSSSMHESREAFVCFKVVTVSDPMYGGWASSLVAGPPNWSVIDDANEALQDLLEPLGLWDEKEFGFWVVATAG